jgi:hypothetical protein
MMPYGNRKPVPAAPSREQEAPILLAASPDERATLGHVFPRKKKKTAHTVTSSYRPAITPDSPGWSLAYSARDGPHS